MILNNIRLPQVPLETTVRNKVPSENIIRTLFLTVIPWETYVDRILLHLSLSGAFFLATNSQ
jgi:hypothetical protein